MNERRHRIRSLLALIPLTLLRGVCADESAAATGSRWSVDDVVYQERPRGWTLARDGAGALFVRHEADRESDRAIARLMLLDLQSGQSRPLTVGKDGLSSPDFSTDGKAVLFLSGRKPPDGEKAPPAGRSGPQLWRLDLGGGEPRPLTAVPHGVGSYEQVGTTEVLFLGRERPSARERELEKRKDDTIVVEDPIAHEDRLRSLFRLELATGNIRRVLGDRVRVSAFSSSPDGRYAVTWRDLDPSFEAEGKTPPSCHLRDLRSGQATEIFKGRRSKPDSAVWRLDSKGCYLLYPQASVDGEDSGAITLVRSLDAATGQIADVPLDWDRGLRHSIFEAVEGGFIAALANGARPRVARYTRTADGHYSRAFLDGKSAPRIFSLTKARDANRVLYVTGSASDPDHIVTARLEGGTLTESKEVHRPNGGFSSKRIARAEVVRWKGALDEEVEGIVYYPNDYDPGKRHPLVVITHGGPHAADTDRFTERWSNSPNLYTQRGAFVLKTNYHGSSDYGLSFGESIKGRYYELEVEDILSGVEMLVGEGKVDADRLGLVGWSNGAILSIACLTLAHIYAPSHDFRFRACAPGAGDVNWTSDYGNCSFGGVFDDYYLGGPPWKLPDLYLKKSPLFHAERVTTPTIIFFGTEDRAVPTSQGWEWYRALHSIGKAPVRFLLFPGEPHGLRKLSHQRRKLEEELRWFDRHLFETEKARDVVPEGSPLDLARRIEGLARVGPRLGVESHGHLVPETVPFGDLDVGRFEVTVAQWRAFDPDLSRAVHESLRASPDHPATGITGDDAKAYVNWLQRETGEGWRLLTTKEFEKLGKSAGPSENTLDYWVGFAPAPPDEKRISTKIRELPIAKVLMRVGSCRPGTLRSGDVKSLVFDVAGNAAEIVVDKNGTLVPRGGCAIHSPDARRPSREVPADFVGLRVAKKRKTHGETRRRKL